MGFVDLIVIAIIVLFALIGYSKGIVYSVLSLASFFVAIIIAKILSEPFVQYVLKDTFNLDKVIIEVANKKLQEQDYVNYAMAKINLVSEAFVNNLLSIISIIILFILVTIVLKIIIAIVDKIIKSIPVVKELNTIGGFIFGFVKGTLIVWVIMAVLKFMIAVPNVQSLVENIQNSILAKYLYENNILLNWLLSNSSISIM